MRKREREREDEGEESDHFIRLFLSCLSVRRVRGKGPCALLACVFLNVREDKKGLDKERRAEFAICLLV